MVSLPKHLVVLARGMLQYRLQALPVGVNVAEDQVSHAAAYAFLKRNSAISGGAPNRTGMPMVPIPRVTYSAAAPRR